MMDISYTYPRKKKPHYYAHPSIPHTYTYRTINIINKQHQQNNINQHIVRAKSGGRYHSYNKVPGPMTVSEYISRRELHSAECVIK